jgi:transmembrane sensor
MSSADNKPYQDLLIKYFSGEAGPEEAMLAGDWIKDPANRAEYESLLKLWNLSGGQRIGNAPPAGESWEELQLQLGERKAAKARSIKLFRYAAAAAAITGIAVLSSLLLHRRPSPADPHVAVVSETAGDSLRTIPLSDGSVVSLNKNSVIRYNASFNRQERRILLSGEAFFDVTPNASKPFTVSVGDLSIRVVGTSFNVRTGAEGGSVEVQVKSGVVKMMASKGEITVSRNQTGIYFTGSRKLLVKNGVDVNSLSYATRTFQFNDLSLLEVCRYLEKSFSVRIDIDREKFSDCRITAQFDNKPLPYILDVIAATVNATYKINNEQVYIEGEGCKY